MGWEKKPNVSAGTTPASVSLVHIPGASLLAKGEKAKVWSTAKRSERKKNSRHAKQQRDFNQDHQSSLTPQVPVGRSERNLDILKKTKKSIVKGISLSIIE